MAFSSFNRFCYAVGAIAIATMCTTSQTYTDPGGTAATSDFGYGYGNVVTFTVY